MRRLGPFLLVFVLGFAACALTVKWLDAQRAGSAGRTSTADIVRRLESTPVAAISDEPSMLTMAAERMLESVVNVDSTGTVLRRDFFLRLYRQRTQASGSGVIISRDGYILTNNHVVGNADSIVVTLHDGRPYDARLIGRDSESDVAVIKIDAQDLVPAAFGDSDALRVAEPVIAIGNPLGLGGTVTMGVVSAPKRRGLRVDGVPIAEAIQTDAAINSGNSGGALANAKGELIGINSAILSTDRGNIGLGFAIPINSARRVAAELIDHGFVRRPWLGVEEFVPVSALSQRYREELKRRGIWECTTDEGVIVQQLSRSGGAYKAGVQLNDVIVKIGGKPIADDDAFVLAERDLKIGDEVQVTIERERKQQTLKVKVTEHPEEEASGG